jgi:fibronectin-binding autotransporter adhesin
MVYRLTRRVSRSAFAARDLRPSTGPAGDCRPRQPACPPRPTRAMAAMVAAAGAAALLPTAAARAQTLVVDTVLGNSPYTVNAAGSGATYTTITVGDGTFGVLNQSAQTLQATDTLTVNANGLGTTPSVYTLTGTGVLNVARETVAESGMGTFNQSGGTHTITSNGTGDASGVLYLGFRTSSRAAYNLSGGTFNAAAAFVGDNGIGTFTQTGGTANILRTLIGGNAATGTYQLNGGTLTTLFVADLSATKTAATFNFNGGTLRPAADDNPFTTTKFMDGLTAANVQVGGAIIDSNGFNNAIPQPLLDGTAGGGGGFLDKRGAGTLTLTGANTYVGGTRLTGGTLNAGSAGALGSTGAISFLGGTLQYSAANATDYSPRFSTAANQAYEIDTNGRAVTLATALTSSGGSLTKIGAGTLTVSGVPTYAGPTTVSGGTLALTGNRTAAAGQITVADGADAATLNLSAGTFAVSGAIAVGAGAAAGSGAGTVNQTGGSVTVADSQLVVGLNAASGAYNLSAGTLTGAASTTRGVILGASTGTTGTFTLSGSGALAMGSSAMQIAWSEAGTATNATGVFNQTGGTAAVGTLSMGGSNATGGAANANNAGSLNLTGGTFAATAWGSLAGGNNSFATIILGGSAQVTLPAFPTAGRGTGATVNVVFNGGTLTPAAASTAYLTGVTAASVGTGGAKLNVPAGRDITIAQPLVNLGAQTGSLLKSGVGALTLSGASAYTGATTVTAGELRITNNFSFNSPISVAAASVLTLDIATDVRLLQGVSGPGPINVTGTVATGRLAGDDSGFTGTFTLPSGARGMMWSNAAAGSAAATWDISGIFGFNETGAGDTTVRLGALRGTNAATQLAAVGGSGVKTFEVGALGTNTTFAGSIRNLSTLGGGGTGTVALTKVGAGTLTLTGTSTYTGPTLLSAGTLLVNGSLAGGATAAGGTLGGSGSVAGPVTVAAATLSPGTSPGRLTFGGDLSLASAATTLIELAGRTAGTAYDQVVVGGTPTVGGTLSVALLSGFVPAAGDAFTILDNQSAAAVAGTFAGLPQGATFTAGGVPLSISYVGGTGNDVVLTAVPEPGTATLAGLAAAGLLARRRRRAAA